MFLKNYHDRPFPFAIATMTPSIVGSETRTAATATNDDILSKPACLAKKWNGRSRNESRVQAHSVAAAEQDMESPEPDDLSYKLHNVHTETMVPKFMIKSSQVKSGLFTIENGNIEGQQQAPGV